MNNERHKELMNGEIDGTNSPEEGLELERLLDSDPEARSYYEDLCRVDRAFRDVAEVPPPPGFRKEVLSSIHPGGRRTARRNYLASVRNAFRPGLAARPAYAFAVGLLVGLCLTTVTALVLMRGAPEHLTGRPGHDYRPYGTIGTGERTGKLLSSQCIPLELPEVYGGACIEHTENSVAVHLGLSSPSEVQVVFEFDDELRFEGYTALDEGEHTLRVAGNEAALTHTGDCDYNLVFRDNRSTGSSFKMRVLESGDLLLEKTISPEGE